MIFATKSGSAMYNLATPESDADFSIVFARPTRELMRDPSAVQRISSTVAAVMGSDKAGVVEFDVKEVCRWRYNCREGCAIAFGVWIVMFYFVVCASINRLLVVCVCVQRLGTVDRLIVMLPFVHLFTLT